MIPCTFVQTKPVILRGSICSKIAITYLECVKWNAFRTSFWLSSVELFVVKPRYLQVCGLRLVVAEGSVADRSLLGEIVQGITEVRQGPAEVLLKALRLCVRK